MSNLEQEIAALCKIADFRKAPTESVDPNELILPTVSRVYRGELLQISLMKPMIAFADFNSAQKYAFDNWDSDHYIYKIAKHAKSKIIPRFLRESDNQQIIYGLWQVIERLS